jgi:thioredoxin reductase (NADPH)
MLKSVLLERGEPGGELLKTEVIEDYPGFEHVLGREPRREVREPRQEVRLRVPRVDDRQERASP